MINKTIETKLIRPVSDKTFIEEWIESIELEMKSLKNAMFIDSTNMMDYFSIQKKRIDILRKILESMS